MITTQSSQQLIEYWKSWKNEMIVSANWEIPEPYNSIFFNFFESIEEQIIDLGILFEYSELKKYSNTYIMLTFKRTYDCYLELQVFIEKDESFYYRINPMITSEFDEYDNKYQIQTSCFSSFKKSVSHLIHDYYREFIITDPNHACLLYDYQLLSKI